MNVRLLTLRAILSGPRYLFALTLLEALAFQAELVDADASAKIEDIVKALKTTREDASG